MKENIKKETNPVSPFPKEKIQKWISTIEEYVLPHHGEENNNRSINRDFYDSIAEILSVIVYKIDRKDKWELFSCENGLMARSDKLRLDISLHAWPGYEFQIKTSFIYPKHIGSMADEFWEHILELEKGGKLSFEENSIPEIPLCLKRQAKKKVKSQVFKIARNYILFSAQEYNDHIDSEDCFEGFGTLEVSWPITIDIEELLHEIFRVFKLYHQINNLLYRHEYILTYHKRR